MSRGDRQAARLAVEEILDAAVALHQAVRRGPLDAVVDAGLLVAEACGRGGKVLAFGNGGSAADAQHFAAELVGRFERERPGLAAVALTTDGSTLTSVANDSGFDRVFARQIEALGRPGDVALAISTSGRSPNVLAAARAARERGLRVVALTGRDGGELGRLADVHVHVAHESTARVQEVHGTLLHAICRIVEGRG
jgi:D-sedoheptulose 7-phosphate isomerase